MNPIAEEIASYLGCSENEEAIAHYGVKRRSGRYPWGSGENPYQHSADFLARVESLASEGKAEKDIAKELGMTTTDLRMQVRVAKHERRALEADRARSLREDGLSLQEIANKMGYTNDSSIRSLLNENTALNKNRANVTAETIAKELETKNMIDVGAGVEKELGVTDSTLKEALFILETKGYQVYGIGLQQTTNPKQQTITTIVAKDGFDQKYAYNHTEEIASLRDYHSKDGGLSFKKTQYPASIDSKRVMIQYGDQGGSAKDGVIELRRGVEDLDLGNSHYAQVRILVDGTHYLKGMVIYADDLPDGVDIRFNTNKPSGTPKEKVMKAIKEDPDNPFGAAIKANGQSYYIGKDGKEHLGAINKIKEEGDWDKMSKNLSSQFLSKQPMKLIRQQLDLTYKDQVAELDDIMSLTNPTVKKKLLLEFANNCDGAATHLKAAAFPRQTTQVILPLTKIKDNEVYAPNYKNGETLALVRYPHGGTFEIPIVTVNNKNAQGKSVITNAVKDAIGISPKTAERLSGADFDGDQVICIPVTPKANIKSTPILDDLKGFDPKTAYPYREGMKVMTEEYKQKQMGMVSNLINDMTLKGANEKEIARAVRHSMVVIDAAKHKLDYTQSEKDNGIAELKQKWQGRVDPVTGRVSTGASTLISRKGQTIQMPETKGSGRINPETGEIEYKLSGRTYVDKKTGAIKEATKEVKLLSAVPDAHILSSGTAQEEAYADYVNKTKALANKARKLYLAEGNLERKPEAAKKYEAEVFSLNSKLNTAAKNAPRERRAIAIANSQVKAKVQANPELQNDKKELKKQKQIAINTARQLVGADSKGSKIDITPKEWEAIQAGAISDSKLTQILRYTDTKTVRALAMPKTMTTLSTAKVSKVKAMSKSGYTLAEIADSLGVSTSTISKYIAE